MGDVRGTTGVRAVHLTSPISHLTSAVLRFRPDQPEDLPRLGMAPELFLGEQERVVETHLEHPAARWSHSHLGVRPSVPDRGRQTDGPWFVVSDGAVFDVDAHGLDGRESEERVVRRVEATIRPLFPSTDRPQRAYGTPARFASLESTVSCLATTPRSESTANWSSLVRLPRSSIVAVRSMVSCILSSCVFGS